MKLIAKHDCGRAWTVCDLPAPAYTLGGELRLLRCRCGGVANITIDASEDGPDREIGETRFEDYQPPRS